MLRLRHRRQPKAHPLRTLHNILPALLSLLILSFYLLFRHLPNSQKTLVLAETRFNGLCAQLLRNLDAAIYAKTHGRNLCIPEPRYWNYGCAPFRTWSCYFHPPSHLPCPSLSICPELATLSESRRASAPCVSVSTPASANITFQAVRILTRQPNALHLLTSPARALWNENSATKVAILTILRKAGPHNWTHFPYIGVHVRRGDKYKETVPVLLTRYISAINLLAPSAKTPVFLATDDGAIITPFRVMLHPRPLYVLPDAELRSGHVQAVQNRVYPRENRFRVVALLAEIYALTRAQVFIGTSSSNVGRVVQLLREGRDVQSSVSLDFQWGPGVAWRDFGHPYCDAQDANQSFCQAFRQL